MEVSMHQLSPGDPRLIDKIVYQLKSNGIFDQFRKECIADVDTKPAYQNLRQRVEGSVSSFLTNQEWCPDLNKNQLRDSLRKHIHESGFLDIGVERIVDQVVNPKVYTVFFPKVEDVVYGFLGVEKPKKGTESQNSSQSGAPKFECLKPEKKFVSLKDLLPTDLDPISPEKLDSDEDMEEVDKNIISCKNEEMIDKKMMKDVTVLEGANEFNGEEKDEDEEDDDEASPPFESLDVESFEANATPPPQTVNSADMLDNITSSSSSSEAKDHMHLGGEVSKHSLLDWKSEPAKGDIGGGKCEVVKVESCAAKKEEKRDVAELGKDWKKYDKQEKSKDHAEKKDGWRRKRSSWEEKKRESSDKRRKNVEDVKQDEVKHDKEYRKVSEHKKCEKGDNRKVSKEDARKVVEVKVDKEASRKTDSWWKQERGEGGKSRESKDDKKRVKEERGGDVRRNEKGKEGRREEEGKRKNGGGKEDRRKGDDKRAKTGETVRKVGEKEKKVRADDHRQERDKGKNSHRRSDRDKDRERERPQPEAAMGQKREGTGPSSTSSAPSSDSNKGNDDGSGEGASDHAKDGGESKNHAAKTAENEPVSESANFTPENPSNLVLKIKKPKIAANIYEVKKIIQVRKNLKKLERERMVSSNMTSVVGPSGEARETILKNCEKSGSKPMTEPPKVKRVRDVEQELRGEIESHLEEDNLGEVYYLEESSKHVDFLIYVHSLSERAACGDFSRIPSPTGSVNTTDLSDFEDVVILSDIEISREEEEVITRLGGQVERKKHKKMENKFSHMFPSCSATLLAGGEGSAKRPRRPNPKYNSGEYSIYSDEEEELLDKKTEVDGMDHWKTPKERAIDEDADTVGKHFLGGSTLQTPENEDEALMKKEGRRMMGRRLGVRGPLRRVAGVSNPGTPDMFVMPLSPESDVSSASGDAGKKLSVNAKEGHYHSAEIDIELGSEEYEDIRGADDGEMKQPLGPPTSGMSRACDLKSHAGDVNQTFCDSGQPSCVLNERRLDDSSAIRRLRGTRSSSRVQQRYSSDDLYKPRPNITLGRRNRGKNSPSQEDVVEEGTCGKQDSRRSLELPDIAISDDCLASKRRKR